jgi:pimeloyl-ACP methyl ester carboxylesterase
MRRRVSNVVVFSVCSQLRLSVLFSTALFAEFAHAENSARAVTSWPGRAAMSEFPEGAAIVMVHGAWADGYCWSNVILPLERRGLNVMCAPIPLTSFPDDVAALSRALERTTGPVVLVGHAYSGAVIAAVREDRVKSLVYVAALAPDEGETVAKVFYREPAHPEAPKLAPDSHGFIWIPDGGFQRAVAHKPRPIKQASRLPCNGQSRFSAFRSRCRRLRGERSPRGF